MAPSHPRGRITVASVLGLHEVRSGLPEILSGPDRVDSPVRWVHVADSEGVGSLMEGGELVLSTAAGFRLSVTRLGRFLHDLEDAGVAGVVVELVDPEGEVDEAAVGVLREAARGLMLPVVLLRRRIKFARVTQAAYRLLLGEQLGRLEHSREVHEVFTDLNLESADEQRILDTTARLLGRAVQVEDAARRVLLRAGEQQVPSAPAGSGQTSRLVTVAVGTAGNTWGRLVAAAGPEEEAEAVLVLERAGQALTLARMAARDQEDLLYRARAGFLQALIGGDVTEEQARERAVMLGLAPAEVYLPLVVHVPPDQDRDLARLQLRERALMDDLLAAARPLALSVVAAALRTGSFAMLLGLSRRVDIDEALTRVVERAEARSAHRDHSPQESPELVWTVGVAAERPSLTAAAAGIEEATQVARTVAATPTRQRPYYRFADIRLPGLMALLADDPRVRTFAEAELAPLLAGQPPWGLDLLGLYLDHGGNKSEVSRAGHLSRQALYARLHRLEEMLGVSLDEPESRAALHVALMWKRGHAVGAGRS